ncbi:hypothetical protein ANN_13869 [Periplaneta americana]|uniref:Uncharacterized protein n=1 Tax=Periplaneta americana TaxID=6978 RepID=A0ABQ8SW10_PERAM|nr:hypothetical protein ANN_13869 [Periplaneta americana]
MDLREVGYDDRDWINLAQDHRIGTDGGLITTRSRHPGCSETETLGHVLGFCKKGELLRNNRHHRARTAIVKLLRNRGWEVHEEIHCVSEDDYHRRVDIIAINRRTQKAMVLDPTICFERDTNQALQINDGKRAKYKVVMKSGFPGIITNLSDKGIIVVTPPYLRDGKLTAEEVETTYSVASVGIHVERMVWPRTQNARNKIAKTDFGMDSARKRRRPRKTWMDDIRSEMKERGA